MLSVFIFLANIFILFSIFRCNMYVGLGYSLVARNVENQNDRKELLSKAEHHYKAAFELDGNDHLSLYYTALHYAETRRPDQAMKAVKRAVELNPEHISSIQLTVLLLSGKAQHFQRVLYIFSIF